MVGYALLWRGMNFSKKLRILLFEFLGMLTLLVDVQLFSQLCVVSLYVMVVDLSSKFARLPRS